MVSLLNEKIEIINYLEYPLISRLKQCGASSLNDKI
jgi:hypothetical protein